MARTDVSESRRFPAGEEHGGSSFFLRRALTNGKIDTATRPLGGRFIEEDATAAPINREFRYGQTQS